MVRHTARKTLVALGMSLLAFAGTVNEAWAQECFEWAERTEAGGPTRSIHSMAFDPTLGVSVLFGGFDAGGETWEFDGGSWELVSAGIPEPRMWCGMDHDAATGGILLFGGTNGALVFGDTWLRTQRDWSRVSTTGPGPRYAHTTTYDAVREETILFGGSVGSSYVGTTWAWDGASWTQVASEGPSPRGHHSTAFDHARGVIVLFGGAGEFGGLGDTWTWDGAEWTEVSGGGPGPRYMHQMVYEPTREVVVLYGGYVSGGPAADTWTFDGTTWSQEPVAGPSARYGHGMCFDSSRSRVVVQGGFGPGELRDTWECRALEAPTITDDPDSQTVDAGATLVLSAGADGSEPRSFRWFHDGIPLSDGGRVSGAGTPTLTTVDVRLSDAGDYTLAVTNPCGAAESDSAIVSVVCTADMNADGVIDTRDVLQFLLHYASGDGIADYNHDGTVNTLDFLAFLNDWAAGC
ncbi:MAG: immunoglobulin domain-containing protein [Phycisphaerales bacterium]|nr:immunoglobulin domain-containing protein [Phycisphaerales bacterium]